MNKTFRLLLVTDECKNNNKFLWNVYENATDLYSSKIDLPKFL